MAGPKKSSPSFARYTAMDSGAISTSLPFITNFLSTYCKLALPRPITDAVDSGEVSRQQQVAPHVWAHLLEILAQAKEDWNLLELLLSEVELHRHLMTFVISFSEVAIPRDVLKFMAKQREKHPIVYAKPTWVSAMDALSTLWTVVVHHLERYQQAQKSAGTRHNHVDSLPSTSSRGANAAPSAVLSRLKIAVLEWRTLMTEMIKNLQDNDILLPNSSSTYKHLTKREADLVMEWRQRSIIVLGPLFSIAEMSDTQRQDYETTLSAVRYLFKLRTISLQVVPKDDTTHSIANLSGQLITSFFVHSPSSRDIQLDDSSPADVDGTPSNHLATLTQCTYREIVRQCLVTWPYGDEDEFGSKIHHNPTYASTLGRELNSAVVQMLLIAAALRIDVSADFIHELSWAKQSRGILLKRWVLLMKALREREINFAAEIRNGTGTAWGASQVKPTSNSSDQRGGWYLRFHDDSVRGWTCLLGQLWIPSIWTQCGIRQSNLGARGGGSQFDIQSRLGEQILRSGMLYVLERWSKTLTLENKEELVCLKVVTQSMFRLAVADLAISDLKVFVSQLRTVVIRITDRDRSSGPIYAAASVWNDTYDWAHNGESLNHIEFNISSGRRRSEPIINSVLTTLSDVDGEIRYTCMHPLCEAHHGVQNRCSGCQIRTYCSVECQTNDWKEHKAFCKANQRDRED